MRIENASYPFTLEGSRLRTLAASPSHVPFRQPRWERDPHPVAGRLWPGSKAFAKAFGRLGQGELTVLEIDPSVHSEAFRFLAAPIGASALELGSHVLYLPPPTLGLPGVWASWSELFPPETFLRNTRIILPDRRATAPPEIESAVVRHPVGAGDKPPLAAPELRDFMRTANPSGAPNVTIVSMQGLRTWARGGGLELVPEALPVLVREHIADGPVHLLFFGHAGDPWLDSLTDSANLRLRLRERHGRLVLYGTHPPTPAYALLVDAEMPGPYELVPMV